MDPTAFLGALVALAAGVSWGTGDFVGGLSTRRGTVWATVLISLAGGTLVLVAIALAAGEGLPGGAALAWTLGSAVASVVGLTALYQGLSIGRMGAVAPVAAVVTAMVPVAYGAFTQGAPGALAWLGFALALAGVALVSAQPGEARGVGLGALAGLGFGGFLVCIHEASVAGTWWPLAVSRGVSALLLAVLVLVLRRPVRGARAILPLALLAMACDVGGNLLYLVAQRLGRLDVAAVLSSLYPASTVAWAALVLHERLRPWQWAGVATLLVSIPLVLS
ncbi:MAG: hypothetical protein QOE90_729 [Thermoplasmata archaeon]|nr:hypothetical protein [Thermoplasmata archaeon]